MTRDLKMALRNPSSFLNPLMFFVISISLFPIAISPEAQTLSSIAPGIIWVITMLSVLLSLNSLFHYDYDSGVLEQMVISHHSLPLILLAKTLAHWMLSGLPIIILSPFLGMALFINTEGIYILLLTLIIATPCLSLIGSIGASLVVGIKNSGMLLSLLILPLYIPILIFATSVVSQSQSNLPIDGQLYFLGFILILSLLITPFLSALSLKISLE
ncbi:heme exporter protein CcmB [Candidatus Pseudothioglobus singularis]|uniref:Heme exporter protein B n=1 Tax=Candidatus Pseudothioglobus singularis PS1 TaxID=1125411 RepID=A0A0M3T1T0_9GAMM|nr:heme exporter protein CcmB [Candidatus Pseudothioglobus singularis]ALE01601.1 cytochrome C biogenesis protein [Candidatus Pseudothioglobus singularis PS1]